VEQIAINETDSDFKYEIASRPGAQHFTRCFSCGTCTASCPVAGVLPEFNPRLMIRRALLGQREELLSSREIWYCAQCYTCYARCPQDVRFTDIVAVLRKMAVEAGHVPVGLLSDMDEIDQVVQRIRRDLADYAIDVESGASTQDEQSSRMEKIAATLAESVARFGAHG